jgi:hypothetical protein
MRARNKTAAVLVALAGLALISVAESSFADPPEKTQTPAETPPPAPAPKSTEDQPPKKPVTAKPAESDPDAARKAAEARIARCRLHPEICQQ